MNQSGEFDLYQDIQTRTHGQLFLGVVGPVRTGKSTFIRRFMNQVVIPNMENEDKSVATDELPVSGKGTLITTVEPKFVPKEAVKMTMGNHIDIKIKLIDCVGYVVEGATGVFDKESERMVKTPWFDEEIPFTKAAQIGTEKVINDHSTIGIVVTCDGSFGEIKREEFIPAEERTVMELKQIGKPFVIVLNSSRPYSEETKAMAEEIGEKYNVSCLPLNCDQLKNEDMEKILQTVLYEFPVTALNFYVPKWMDMLCETHPLRVGILETVKEYINHIFTVKDIEKYKELMSSEYLEKCYIESVDMATGNVTIQMSFAMKYYYEMLSSILGKPIHGEYEFFKELGELTGKKNEFMKVSQAIEQVHQKGYGVVAPQRDEIVVEEPQIIKHGNKFGVNIKATAPSIHMISAAIQTEIAPIVGTQQQAQDLIDYIKSAENGPEQQSIWETLIFGKTMGELVDEGIKTKVGKMTDNCQEKLQETLQKIINESNGNVIFVII